MIEDILKLAREFEDEARLLLAKHETSHSRVISLEKAYERLGSLSLNQEQLLGEALKCTEHGFFRAAHVLAWAGFMDFLEEKLSSDGFVKLRTERAKWSVSTIEDLREQFPEYQLIEAARDVGLCGKSQSKTLLGMLSKRNECAHPSGYDPELNETLGYVSELLRRIELLKNKTL